MKGRVLAAAALAAVCAGCIQDTRATRERGGAGLFERAPVIEGPEVDRCARLAGSGARPGCDDAKYLGQSYVRRLAATDEVCLEGGFGEVAGGGCLARAWVADVDQGRVLLEIRDATPESRWYQHVQHQLWFTEEALLDLYLAERGY